MNDRERAGEKVGESMGREGTELSPIVKTIFCMHGNPSAVTRETRVSGQTAFKR
jgi:hypothetical protein